MQKPAPPVAAARPHTLAPASVQPTAQVPSLAPRSNFMQGFVWGLGFWLAGALFSSLTGLIVLLVLSRVAQH